MGRGVLEPVSNAMRDLLRHDGGQLIRLARFERLFCCGDGRPEIRTRRLQPGIRRFLAGAVEADRGLHEVAVSERLGLRPVASHGERLLVGGAQFGLGLNRKCSPSPRWASL